MPSFLCVWVSLPRFVETDQHLEMVPRSIYGVFFSSQPSVHRNTADLWIIRSKWGLLQNIYIPVDRQLCARHTETMGTDQMISMSTYREKGWTPPPHVITPVFWQCCTILSHVASERRASERFLHTTECWIICTAKRLSVQQHSSLCTAKTHNTQVDKTSTLTINTGIKTSNSTVCTAR